MPYEDSFYIDYTNRQWNRLNREAAFYESRGADSLAAALRRQTSRTACAKEWDADDVGDLTYEVSGSIYFRSTDPYRGYQVKCTDCGHVCHAMGLHWHRFRYCPHRLAEDAKPLPSRLEFRTLQRRWYEWRHFVGLRPIRELTAQAIAKQAAMKAVPDDSEDLTYEISGSIYFIGTDHYQYLPRKCVDCGKVCRARDLHQHRSHFCQQWVDKAEDPLPSRLEFRALQRCWDVWSDLLEQRLVRKFRAQALATKAPTKAKKKQKKKQECHHLLEDLTADPLQGQGCVGGPSSFDVSPLPLSVSPQSAVVDGDISDSECDPSRSLTQASRSTQDLKVLGQAWSHWLRFVENRRCYSDLSNDSFDSERVFDDFGCDLPRSSTQDFQFGSTSCSDDSFIADAYESYEIPKRYGSDCSSCSDDSSLEGYDDIEERNLMVNRMMEYEAWLNATRARQPRRAACHITVTTADLDGTWELPSLAESDCDGELELIRYTICTSAMTFEDSAAAAVAWERSLSLGSRLDRSHSAFQLASVKDYWVNRQGYLRRRHAPRAPLAKFSTKRGRRQHQQELRRARAHRKSHRNDMPRPAQPEVQFRSPFPFAPPTAPTIPPTAYKGVFTFGAAVRSNPSAPRTGNLNTDHRPHGRDTGTRSALTAQSDRPKVHRGPDRRKQNGVILNSDVLQPDNLSSPVADGSVEDSDHASAASTVPLLVTLFSLIRGLRPDLPHRRRKVRSYQSSRPVPQLPTTDTDSGKHRRESRRHSPRCTRALMRALGRSKWLNGLCRGLHRGCTDGTGPRPSVEP